jgi:hypothetical protein
MPEVVVNGGVLVFEPSPLFSWVGWDGKVPVRAGVAPFLVDGQRVAVAEDLVASSRAVCGHGYKALAFPDIPGSVLALELSIEEDTLTSSVVIDGNGSVVERTRGTYAISCSPSYRAGLPPVPDPLCQSHRGTWRIEESGQGKASVK